MTASAVPCFRLPTLVYAARNATQLMAPRDGRCPIDQPGTRDPVSVAGTPPGITQRLVEAHEPSLHGLFVTAQVKYQAQLSTSNNQQPINPPRTDTSRIRRPNLAASSERRRLTDGNKTDPGNLGKRLDPRRYRTAVVILAPESRIVHPYVTQRDSANALFLHRVKGPEDITGIISERNFCVNMPTKLSTHDARETQPSLDVSSELRKWLRALNQWKIESISRCLTPFLLGVSSPPRRPNDKLFILILTCLLTHYLIITFTLFEQGLANRFFTIDPAKHVSRRSSSLVLAPTNLLPRAEVIKSSDSPLFRLCLSDEHSR
ncbi:hypothetical protein T265_05413 [Opisthorchis viverrini]|uniref:Uncharacterized protein n=1 Tax=Opisthorchis viverrini TaxID=6198 RepID=A0A074ZW56_OPIVI|nr:hypothetical protein T265_05413 [Opisthorchis viverrini]KER27600.1 hypothetical protein T265_05413 [Opisthorchis viverrini]